MPEIKRITSPRNQVVRDAAKLLRGRDRNGPFLIEGPNLLGAALRRGSNGSVERIFFTGEFFKKNASLIESAFSEAAAADFYELSPHVFEKLCATESPQGIAAIARCEPGRLDRFDLPKGPVVVFDGVSDPGNLGAIIRTADASGASGVIVLEGTCDVFGPKALRASAGSAFNIPVMHSSRHIALAELKALGISIAVTVPEAGEGLFSAELSLPLAIVFGNESSGVSPEALKAADLSVSIPVHGGAESLNVSAAAAVVLYETLRQRGPGATGPI